MDEICRLGFKEAVEAISGTEKVMYKHGVWNKYELRNTKDAVRNIMNSGYGADVYYNKETDMYYVEIPCDADMW